MNDNCLLENIIDDCDQLLIENLNDECLKLKQEIQEICNKPNLLGTTTIDNVMFNSYPTPIETPLVYDETNINTLSSEFPETNSPLIMIDQNSSSGIFDPIAVSNGLPEDTPIGSEKIINENEIIKMLMDNFIENAPLGNVCNGIDYDILNHNLLSMQENSLVNTEIPMDASVESLLEEIENNSVSLLETTFDSETDGNLVNRPIDPMEIMDNILSKIRLHSLLHNEKPS